MRYVELKTKLIEHSGVTEPEIVAPKELFVRILTAALANIQFDGQWYLEKYEDVRDALAQKKIASAEQHYIQNGYFEDRFPCEIAVDEEFYLKENPDVQQAIVSGAFKDSQEHFDRCGFAEGRLPYRGFQLF